MDKKMQAMEFIRTYTDQRKVSPQLQRNVVPLVWL